MKMLGISSRVIAFFKTEGPRTMAGATPSHFSFPSGIRNCNQLCRVRNFGASLEGVIFPADFCSADSSPLGTTRKPRTLTQLPRPNFVAKNSVLQVRSFIQAIRGVGITHRSLGETQ